MANIYDMADTWNDGGTTFTAIKMDVTDTASASDSRLMDLQVGGTSRFKVEKGGNNLPTLFVYSDNAGSPNIKFGNIFNFNITQFGSSLLIGDGIATSSGIIGVKSGNINIHTSRALTWTNGNAYNGAIDLYLSRKGAANLRFGAADAAAPVAQTLSVQSVVAGTTNTNGADFTIEGSQGTGTGAGGSILFKVAPAGSSGTGQNALATALTIGPDKRITMNAPSDFNSMLKFESNVGIGSYVNNSFFIRVSGDTPFFTSASDKRITIGQGYYLGWRQVTGGGATSEPDVKLYNDAPGTLALRNGGTNLIPVPQTFNVYNYWASASDYERGFMKWNSNVLEIGTEAAGSGTGRIVKYITENSDNADNPQFKLSGYDTGLTLAGNDDVFIVCNNIVNAGFQNSGLDRYLSWNGAALVGFCPGEADGSIDTSLVRVSSGILGVRAGGTTSGGALNLLEQTAPSAPAANQVVIYAEDDGAGKTRLMALFPTGAAQQIAIEP